MRVVSTRLQHVKISSAPQTNKVNTSIPQDTTFTVASLKVNQKLFPLPSESFMKKYCAIIRLVMILTITRPKRLDY